MYMYMLDQLRLGEGRGGLGWGGVNMLNVAAAHSAINNNDDTN